VLLHSALMHKADRLAQHWESQDLGIAVDVLGSAVQVDPMKPSLTAPGSERLKVKCDDLLSSSGFEFNLRRYSWGLGRWH
jgi:hypothetical protein